jgi:hypothetical protein
MLKWISRFISEVQPCTAVVLIYLSESGTQGLEVSVMTVPRRMAGSVELNMNIARLCVYESDLVM